MTTVPRCPADGVVRAVPGARLCRLRADDGDVHISGKSSLTSDYARQITRLVSEKVGMR